MQLVCRVVVRDLVVFPLDPPPNAGDKAEQAYEERDGGHNLRPGHGFTPQSFASFSFSVRICRLVPSVILSWTGGLTGRAMSQ